MKTGTQNPHLSPAAATAGKRRSGDFIAAVRAAEDARRDNGKKGGGSAAVKLGVGWLKTALQTVVELGVAKLAELNATAATIAAEQAEDAEFAAEILESKVKAQAVAKETRAEAEQRLGRKVATRGIGEPVRAEDMEFWRDLFSGNQDSPASSVVECWLHEDCGNAQLAHIVVTTLRLREPHVITICWMGRKSFYAVVDELNAEREKPRRFSAFDKLEGAEAKAVALAAAWGVGRRVGGKAERTGTTSVDEIKARGKGRRRSRRPDDVDMGRPCGAAAWDPAWDEPTDINQSPYLIEYVLRERAARFAMIRKEMQVDSDSRPFNMSKLQAAFAEERRLRKQATIERRQAFAAGKMAKLDRNTPATQVILMHQASEKFRRMALRGWQKRRGEQVTVVVTMATLGTQSKPTAIVRLQKRRSFVKRGKYIRFGRQPRSSERREVHVGWTRYSEELRRGMLKAMGQDLLSPVPTRGEAVAGKKEGKGGKKS